MSLIDILQPCVSFNRINTHQWYAERVFQLGKMDYPTNDIRTARDKVQEWGNRIPIGIFYKKEKPTFTDHISSLQKKTLFEHNYNPKRLKRVFQRFNPDPA
jgi:2-oxoglutarate ferredoxin oxidoreductase subunit beta